MHWKEKTGLPRIGERGEWYFKRECQRPWGEHWGYAGVMVILGSTEEVQHSCFPHLGMKPLFCAETDYSQFPANLHINVHFLSKLLHSSVNPLSFWAVLFLSMKWKNTSFDPFRCACWPLPPNSAEHQTDPVMMLPGLKRSISLTPDVVIQIFNCILIMGEVGQGKVLCAYITLQL